MQGLPRLVLNEAATVASFVYARICPKDERFECFKRRAQTENQGGGPSTAHPKSLNQPRREMHPKQTFLVRRNSPQYADADQRYTPTAHRGRRELEEQKYYCILFVSWNAIEVSGSLILLPRVKLALA